MKPQISIIIPVYNAEKYINECVASILKQEFTDYEIILINDGSTDNSGFICRNLTESDQRIHYIEQKNTGVCGARNAGLDAAVGELIFFMDSDDWLESDSLSVLYKEYKRTNSDLIVADIRFVGSIIVRDLRVFNQNFTINDKEWIDRYEMACIGYGYNPNPGTKYNLTGLGSMGNKLYKRDIIETNRLRFDPYTMGIYEDNLFVLHYLINSKSITYISKIVYNYREVVNSNSRGFKSGTLEINERIFSRIQDFIIKYKLENKNEYTKAFYIYVIRRLEVSLSVYFFAKGNTSPFIARIIELHHVLRSEPYITAIREVDMKKLKPSHRLTCLTAKSQIALIVWVGYISKQIAFRIISLGR